MLLFLLQTTYIWVIELHEKYIKRKSKENQTNYRDHAIKCQVLYI